MNQRFACLCIASIALISLLAVPAHAQDSKIRNETGHLFLGNGLTLSATKPRLLTANVNVAQFLYSPTGARIAYITDNRTNTEEDTSLAIVATQSGETKVYLSGALDPSAQITQLPAGALQIEGLVGWSDDAHYLAFSAMSVRTPQGSDTPILFNPIQYVDLVRGDVSAVPFPPETLQPPPASADALPMFTDGPTNEPGKLQSASMWAAQWAPGENMLAFVTSADFEALGTMQSLCVFDPARQSAQVLLSQKRSGSNFLGLMGWLDGKHLEYRLGKDRFVYDMASGKSEPAPKTAAVVHRTSLFDEQPVKSVPAQPQQILDVSADSQPVTAQTETYGDATSIWIQRQAGPAKRNRLLVDVFRGPTPLGWNPGDRSSAQFAPNGGFDRQGSYQVAYLAQGDLKVCDLSIRPATLMERALGGEKLPCDLQERLALENAKQMGLAMLMYAQDNDEHFPGSDGFDDNIKPYLQPDFSIDLPNIAPFHYIEPQNLALAGNESPADTPIGTYQLPCGTATVYMDGHARVNQNVPGGG